MNGYDLELFNRFLDALKEVNIEWKLTELDGDFNYTAIVKEKEISITLKSSNVIIFEIAKQFSHVISQGNPLQKKILDLVGHTEYYCEFNSEAVNYMLSIVNQNKELSEDDIAILSNFFKIKKYEYQNKNPMTQPCHLHNLKYLLSHFGVRVATNPTLHQILVLKFLWHNSGKPYLTYLQNEYHLSKN